jgi:hypothetical protein
MGHPERVAVGREQPTASVRADSNKKSSHKGQKAKKDKSKRQKQKTKADPPPAAKDDN